MTRLNPRAWRAVGRTITRHSPFRRMRMDTRYVDRFPRVLYLAPEPAAPFVELTQAIAARWPDHQPYGGEFDSVVPHVTVVNGVAEPPGLAEKL